MSSIEDKRQTEEDERVRSILGPQSDEDRNKERAAKKATEEQMAQAREQRKTGNVGRLFLLVLVVTLLFAAARYLLDAGSL